MASKKSKTNHIDKYNSGVVFYNKGEFTKAILEFKSALSSEPKSEKYAHALANAYNNRGVAKYEAKKYEDAEGDFRKAYDIDKKNGQYMQNLKLARDSAHKHKVDVLCKGAYDMFGKKNYSESVRMLRDALKTEPEDKEIARALAVAYNGRGVLLYEQGRFEQAIKEFEAAHEVYPSENQYKLNLNWTKEAARRAARKKK